MSASSHYDALVVGAGPAGACAARTLAAGGARVLMLDKAVPPRYKTCGGGVVRRVLDTLPFDLEQVVEARCRHVELNMAPELRFCFRDTRPLLAMTMRARLDALLTEEAVQAGAELRAPCHFRGLTEHSTGLRVETTDGPVGTRLVIGCDGVNSSVARAAGWKDQLPAIPACEWEVHPGADLMARFSDSARFDFDAVPGGYGWVFPKAGHLSVGVGRAIPGPFGGPRLAEGYLHRLGLGAVDAVERHGYVIPARPRSEGPAQGRVLLAGDAAGLVDPVTWEGISYATASGILAGETLLETDLDPRRAIPAYRKAVEREILADIRLGRVLAGLLYHSPRLRAWTFRRFGQRLCQGMIRVVTGQATYRALLSNPRNYLRLFTRATDS